MYKSLIFIGIIIALLAGSFLLWGKDRKEKVLPGETHVHADGASHTH